MTTRTPREAKPWPYRLEDTGAAIAAVIASAVGVLAAAGYLQSLFFAAGVREVDFVGALAAYTTVLGSFFAAATLYRWGHPMRSVYIAATIGVVLAVALPVVAHLAAHRGWLTTVLGTAFVLAIAAVHLLVAVMFALHSPSWWRGWHQWPQPEHEVIPNENDPAPEP